MFVNGLMLELSALDSSVQQAKVAHNVEPQT